MNCLPLTVTDESGCQGLPIQATDDGDVTVGRNEAEAPTLLCSGFRPRGCHS